MSSYQPGQTLKEQDTHQQPFSCAQLVTSQLP